MIRFGSFQVDPRTWLLTEDGRAVDLSPRLVEILAHIVSASGAIVTKDELLERFWPDVHISDNTLTRAIADIRKALGDDAGQPRFLETVSRRGFRFVGDAPTTTPAVDPFQEWVKGRLALDTLDVTKLDDAVRAFERAVAELPRYAPAQAGLANAYMLQYERTRSGSVPDRSLLVRAMTAAREAATLDPSLGEAWAVLGYLLNAAGKTEEGQAAARRATALEPENWRHFYRLAYGSWGEERLRAVDRTLALMPGVASVRMLACMVFVARGTIDRAEREAAIGVDMQRQQLRDRTPLPSVGHHWLHGLILLSQGHSNRALASFEEEIAAAANGHVYAREFAVNALVGTGFLQLSNGNAPAAATAFARALSEAPGHPKASVGSYALAWRNGDRPAIEGTRAQAESAIADLMRGERHVEASLVSAGKKLVEDDADQAIDDLDRMLATAPAGPAGWIIPIDPMLSLLRDHPRKQALFAKLSARAA